eukprot:353199-Pelagomonas_calceolata.AAC.1
MQNNGIRARQALGGWSLPALGSLMAPTSALGVGSSGRAVRTASMEQGQQQQQQQQEQQVEEGSREGWDPKKLQHGHNVSTTVLVENLPTEPTSEPSFTI